MVGLALVGFAVVTLVRAVREAPARQMRAELTGVGTVLVTVRLTPDPPKVGAIPLTIEVTDARGTGVAVDTRVSLLGSDSSPRIEVALRRAAQGSFLGTVLFPSIGAWWLDVDLVSGPTVTRVRFPVRVVANI